jgi:hypothetical protein
VTSIQHQLGYRNLAVTTRYLGGLGEEEHLERVRAAFERVVIVS